MNLTDLKTIQPLMEKHGFHFSKSLGQNFLVRQWVPERILEVSGASPATGVLEIGPGIGVLTQELCRQAGKVVSVELDTALLPVLDETLAEFDNVQIINQDIMKTDIAALVQEHFAGLTPIACANLPYNITTPVLTKLLDSGCFPQITVMIQREVAKRICAKPGTADYGAFTVYVNYHAVPEICFDVPPDCFLPRPKVTSSVICLRAKEPPKDLMDKTMFFNLVKASFAQRRKTLVNGLSALFSGRLDKAQITEVLQQCGFSPMVRGETLGISEFVALSNAFTARLQKQ